MFFVQKVGGVFGESTQLGIGAFPGLFECQNVGIVLQKSPAAPPGPFCGASSSKVPIPEVFLLSKKLEVVLPDLPVK